MAAAKTKPVPVITLTVSFPCAAGVRAGKEMLESLLSNRSEYNGVHVRQFRTPTAAAAPAAKAAAAPAKKTSSRAAKAVKAAATAKKTTKKKALAPPRSSSSASLPTRASLF